MISINNFRNHSHFNTKNMKKVIFLLIKMFLLSSCDYNENCINIKNTDLEKTVFGYTKFLQEKKYYSNEVSVYIISKNNNDTSFVFIHPNYPILKKVKYIGSVYINGKYIYVTENIKNNIINNECRSNNVPKDIIDFNNDLKIRNYKNSNVFALSNQPEFIGWKVYFKKNKIIKIIKNY